MPVTTLQPESVLILAGIAYLSLKHYIADFCVQTPFQFRNKGRYGHPGGLLHSAIHAVLTAPILLILPPATLTIAAAIVGIEFLVHYHVDWCKEQVTRLTGWTAQTAQYWQLFGFDQLLHALTYIAIITALLLFPGR